MHVIVLASQKGGAGKTTLTAHLSVAAHASGAGSVVAVDTDPQGTLTRWWEQRDDDAPALAAAPASAVAAKIATLAASGYAFAFIDTPPAITESIRAVIACADLVLLPVRPSPADLWAVGGTLELCREQGRPFAFAMTQATKGATITLQAMGALSEHGTVAGSVIHSRVAYAGALTSGQVIQELDPKGLGAQEIAALWAFVQARLPGSVAARKQKRTQ